MIILRIETSGDGGERRGGNPLAIGNYTREGARNVTIKRRALFLIDTLVPDSSKGPTGKNGAEARFARSAKSRKSITL